MRTVMTPSWAPEELADRLAQHRAQMAASIEADDAAINASL